MEPEVLLFDEPTSALDPISTVKLEQEILQLKQTYTHQQALSSFRKLFVEQALISAALNPLIDNALRAVGTPDPESAFTVSVAEVGDLLAEVRKLYEGMGPSLRFAPPASCGVTPVATVPAVTIHADQSVDYRGVSCPLNYVKTKMVLAKMAAGQILAVLLDGEGAKNVPASATNDGHEVVAMEQHADHWRVLIRKT